ncbi:MAG: hypothetical protein GY856_36775 [bacterium]|nr:hypothetical protein [bacterium]
MAATFVVEDGSGSSTANAYCTKAEADQYHENYGDPSAWSDLSDAEKEDAIRIGSQYLDAKYGLRWKGYPSNTDQALDWPRGDVYDEGGILQASDELPTAIIDATAVAALKSVSDTLLPDVSNPGRIKRIKSQVGPLVSEKEYMGGRSAIKRYSLVDAILKGLLTSPNTIRRA